MQKIKDFFNKISKSESEKESFRWSSISSRDQKRIIKDAVSGSNKLQKSLYEKARLM